MVTAYVRPAPTGKVGQRDDTDGVIITKSNNEDDARPIFGQISFGSTKAGTQFILDAPASTQ